MRLIGESINDAIDWTQDLLQSTRPIAETVLFALMHDQKVREMEDGYALFEDDDEELKRRGTLVKHSRRYHRRGTHRLRLKTVNTQLTNRQLHDADDDSDHEKPDALL